MSDQIVSIEQYIGTVISGSELIRILNGIPLVKFMYDSNTHYGMRYVTGYNKDIVPFNPHGFCCKGGLYVTALNKCNIYHGSYGQYARRAMVGPDTLVYVERDKFKCSEIWLSDRVPKDELLNQMFSEYVLSQGSDRLMRICESNPETIRWIDPGIRTNEMRLCSVQHQGLMIQWIEPEYQTLELSTLSVKNDSYALMKIKPEYLTPGLIVSAIKNTPSILHFVPKQWLTDSVIKGVIHSNGWLIEHMDIDVEPWMLMMAIKQDSNVIQIFEDQDNGYVLTRDMAIEALKQNGTLIDLIGSIDPLLL
jgi:hypothetical protein